VARADQPVDLNHLDRYTGGDRATNEESCACSTSNAARSWPTRSLGKVETLGAADAKSWRDLTHTLKGAARGIGAFDLGDAVATAETGGPGAAEALARISQEAAPCAILSQSFSRRRPELRLFTLRG